MTIFPTLLIPTIRSWTAYDGAPHSIREHLLAHGCEDVEVLGDGHVHHAIRVLVDEMADGPAVARTLYEILPVGVDTHGDEAYQVETLWGGMPIIYLSRLGPPPVPKRGEISIQHASEFLDESRSRIRWRLGLPWMDGEHLETGHQWGTVQLSSVEDLIRRHGCRDVLEFVEKRDQN